MRVADVLVATLGAVASEPAAMATVVVHVTRVKVGK